jgi:hypothetical protein
MVEQRGDQTSGLRIANGENCVVIAFKRDVSFYHRP